jgi:hypothetical protein
MKGQYQQEEDGREECHLHMEKIKNWIRMEQLNSGDLIAEHVGSQRHQIFLAQSIIKHET